MNKRFITTFLAIATATGLVACGSQSDKVDVSSSSSVSASMENTGNVKTNGSSEQSKASELKGPGNVTLKRMGSNVSFDPNTDQNAQLLEQVTGYKAEYTALPAENADEKLAMEVAGGADYDVIRCSYSQFQTLMSQGALQPIENELNAYGQDILKGVSENAWKAVTGKDGHVYGIPYMHPYPTEILQSIACRWDLMQAAGIKKMPETLSEFHDCLKTLKDYYGDKYIIFTGPYEVATSSVSDNWRFPKAVGNAYGIYNDWMTDDSGKVYYMLEDEHFKDMVDYLSELQKEGLIDPDWAVNTGTNVEEKFAGGRAIMAASTRPMMGTCLPTMQQTLGLSDDDIKFIGTLKGDDGTCKVMNSKAIESVSVVLKSSKNVADAINWINIRQQNQLYLNIGTEGETFKYDEDGTIVPINPTFSDQKANSWWYMDSSNEEEFAKEWPARVRKSEGQWLAFSETSVWYSENEPEVFVENPFTYVPALEMYSKENPSLFNNINDFMMQVLSGVKTSDDVDDLISEWKNSGGEEVKKELQDWYDDFYQNN